MKKITLEVNGMTCDHCVQTIKGTLNKIIGLNLIHSNTHLHTHLHTFTLQF